MMNSDQSADQFYLECIEPIKSKMMHSIARIVRDPEDIADVFQNALYKIWNYVDRIAMHPNPQGYIMCICTSAAYDFLRSKYRTANYERPLDFAVNQFPIMDESKVVKQEVVNSIQKGIAELPFKQAQTVMLRLFEEESFETISDILQCSEATVRSNFSKGLARLRIVLTGMEVTLSEVEP